jgi:hypothetical protein
MRELRIALDVEGVLADTHAVTAEHSDLLDADEVPPQNYDFEHLGQEHYDEYMHVSQNLWHNHNHRIPPMQDGLWKATRTLNNLHDVDILTARTGVDRQVQDWLDGYNVRYNEFIVTDDPRSDKTEYGDYDVHIEDSPQVTMDALTERRWVVLVDRPYNLHIGGSRVRRVSGVTEAASMLSDPEVTTEMGTL